MAKIAGITIKLDADASGIEKALRDIDDSLKKTQSNLRNLNKALKFDPSNTDLLRQKQKNLQDAIKLTKDRVEQLKQAQSQVARGSAEWEALQQEIVMTESQLKQLEAEYKEFGSVAKQQIKVVSDKMKEIGGKITNVGKRLTTSLTLPLVAAFTVAANSASDLEENMNKIDVAFGDSADAVKEWSDNAMRQFGLSKVAASDAVSSFGALGKGIGLSSDSAAEMSTTLAGLSADLASYFNAGTDESAKALEGIFTGEAEALKKFGVVMNDTNLQAFAEEQGLVWKELDQSEKTMVRYQYVLSKTQDAQGDYARTSDGTANSIKTFKAALSDLGTAIGTQLLPIITPLIQKVTDIITKFSELDPHTQKIIMYIGLALAALGPIVTLIGGLVTVMGALLSPIGLVIVVIGALVAAGVLLYKNWDKIKAFAIGLWNAVVTVWNNMKATVVNAAIAIKDGAVNAWNTMVQTVTTVMATFKTAITTAWDGIKARVANVVANIRSKVQSMVDKFNSAKDAVKAAIDKLKSILNTTLSFPKIKVPHFNISGGEVPWGIGGKGYPPSISIDWYRRAYDNPIMFTQPTVLATAAGMKGFGDGSGAEIVMSLEKLQQLVGAQSDRPVVVQVALEGDARGLFKAVQKTNLVRTKATNYNALAVGG